MKFLPILLANMLFFPTKNSIEYADKELGSILGKGRCPAKVTIGAEYGIGNHYV
jgi:hypothetical protein